MSSRGLLIGGETRSGKSTLFRFYLSLFPIVTQLDLDSGKLRREGFTARQLEIIRYATLRRVILIELKVRPSRRSIAADILEQLTGTRPRDRQDTSEILGLIRDYGIEMGTELLLVDEVHHAINGSNDESTEILSEFFKSLLNITPFQIAFAGLPKIQTLEECKQFKERLEPTFLLTPYDWTRKSGRVEFCALLGKFDLLLRLPEISGLRNHALAKRIYVASLGEVGLVSKLLSEALLLAHERELSKVDIELLGEVFESFSPSDGRENVEEDIDFDAEFDPDTELRRFVKLAEDENPFLCDGAGLRQLWNQAVRQRTLKAFRSSSNRTRLRATGPKPVAPFS